MAPAHLLCIIRGWDDDSDIHAHHSSARIHQECRTTHRPAQNNEMSESGRRWVLLFCSAGPTDLIGFGADPACTSPRGSLRSQGHARGYHMGSFFLGDILACLDMHKGVSVPRGIEDLTTSCSMGVRCQRSLGICSR